MTTQEIMRPLTELLADLVDDNDRLEREVRDLRARVSDLADAMQVVEFKLTHLTEAQKAPHWD